MMESLVGKQFNRLKVISLAESTKKPYVYKRLCRCNCGSFKIIDSISLKYGRTRSCGCLAQETRTKHKEYNNKKPSPELKAYYSARERCHNPKSKDYRNYGKRGIQFFFTSFNDFLKHLGRRPEKHSLDRINNSGNYEQGNVRWAANIQQARNKRTNHIITMRSESLCIAEWAARFNHPPRLVHQRLLKGWCGECAVTLPVNSRCNHKQGC